ncbi:MAG: hypothetical protein ACQEXJ_00955 [Myxococcota bacterium]
MAKYRTAPDPNETGYPSGIKYIIGNEGCERFSYYGMKAILYVYVVGLYINLRGTDPKVAELEATATTHLFFAAVYGLPLIGAIVADRLLGKYWTILTLSIVYCLGHLALAVFEDPYWQQEMLGAVLIDPIQGLYIGLGLIAVGSGGIKPCVSAHVGDQFGRSNWHLLQKVFNAFYFIINFGSAFATIFIPWIRGEQLVDAAGHYYYTGSVSWAFGIPGILMGLATLFFWMGRKDFVHVPPTHPGKRGLLDVLAGSALFLSVGVPAFFHDVFTPTVYWTVSAVSLVVFGALFVVRQRVELDDGFLSATFYSIRARLFRRDVGSGEQPEEGGRDYRDHWLYGPAARRFGQAAAEGPVAVWKIVSVFALVSVFWALFDQHSSTWIAQARLMDMAVELSAGGWLFLGALVGGAVGLAFLLTLRKTPIARLLMLVAGVAGGLVLGWIAYSNGPMYKLQPSQVPALNPFMVMLLIPYTTFGLYPLMERLGFTPRPLRRMTIGMFVASLAFVSVALLQHAVEAGAISGEPVHVGWQLIPYFILTLSEVMVSITGLEFAYSQAPKRMKSVVMGFWLLCIAFGNLLVVFLAGFEDLPLEDFFWVFAALMGAAALLFGIRAAFYTYQDYTQ